MRYRALVSSVVVIALSAGVTWAATNGGGPEQQPLAVAPPPAPQPALASVPWDPNLIAKGPPRRVEAAADLPSVVFPRGTGRAEALAALWIAYREKGELPAGAVLGDPLPVGRIWAAESPNSGPRVSLAAPFGWDLESRTVTYPSWHYPEGVTSAEAGERGRAALVAGKALPEGALLDVAPLRACQVLDVTQPDAPSNC